MVNKGRQITPGTIDATDEKVITIRQQYATGLFSRSELAELHGVSEGQVQSYNSGTYKNFPNMVRLRKIKVNGGALKSIRLAKNLTQNDVEITLGLGQGAMSRMERGRLPESYLYSVSRLAEYFGVEVDSITR